ncbi:MAG: hypothetical protein HY758_05820 [Nitrospirae bacterium]|nr:hypothetical protein [Nitrospirota bacterium]
MAKSLKYLVEAPFSTIKYIYKFARHVDYRRLNQYILNINQNYDLEGILYELSRCLKDILDYELFCFTIKDSDTIHIWIDPRAYRASFLEMIKKDFPGQNIDCQVHYFDKKTLENGNHAVRNTYYPRERCSIIMGR